VWTVGTDGTDPKRIPIPPEAQNHITNLSSWSADGRTFAADNVLHISLVDAETGAVTPLGDGEQAALSPDGTQVAFNLYDSSIIDNQIWIMDIDGSNRRVIAQHDADDAEPVWSPDGKYIAFSSRRAHFDLVSRDHSLPEARGRQYRSDAAFSAIYVARADGSEVTLLTPIPSGVEAWEWDATHPSWGN